MRRITTITPRRLVGCRLCGDWPRDRVYAMFRQYGKRSVTPLEFAKCKRIPVDDRIWVLLTVGVFTDTELRLFACWAAERELRAERRRGNEPDERSWIAVRVSRRYAHGSATADDLAAARAAAWAAAGAAAGAAAREAAGEAQLQRLCRMLQNRDRTETETRQKRDRNGGAK